MAGVTSRFDVYTDSSENDHSGFQGNTVLSNISNNKFTPLRSVSISNSQNSQSRTPTESSPTKSSPKRQSPSVEFLASKLKELQIAEPHELNRVNGKPNWNRKPRVQGGRLNRPLLTSNTFEALETVPEDPSGSAAIGASDNSQHYIELPADQYEHHPLASATHHLPSASEQLTKHRNGDFEWILKISLPRNQNSDSAIPEFELFGCNLVPNKTPSATGGSAKDISPNTYALLVTPLEGDEDLLRATKSLDENKMDVTEIVNGHATPSKNSALDSQVRAVELSPGSIISTSEDNSFVYNKSRSPAISVSRIEDSLDALDQLEDQLEAFDVAARVQRAVQSPKQQLPTNNTRLAPQRCTPQPNRSTPRLGSTSRGFDGAEARRTPSSRKSASKILLDSPKLKEEDKALMHAPSKKSTGRGIASLQPPKQPAKSTKPPTVSSFELPGEAVSRRLKEQREARLATQAPPAKAPPSGGLRRTQSAKAPTRPHFELPGEAISRRRREQREARLKAQEEEERKRREFKAKPIRSSVIPSSVPRETIASRARQNKAALVENPVQPTLSSPDKRESLISREPLSNTHNLPPRGRNTTTTSSSAPQVSRAISSSTGTTSGKRYSVSADDTQQQRLRGKEVWERDNTYMTDRLKEQREREKLARSAREQAAERSRLMSREWAEKQKRKRMTVSCLKDIAT